jgi:hypothetical protein
MMRTTVDLDADAERAVTALREGTGLGLSQAVNELIRRGLLSAPAAEAFHQRTKDLGLKIDVSNTAEALEILEGAEAR